MGYRLPLPLPMPPLNERDQWYCEARKRWESADVYGKSSISLTLHFLRKGRQLFMSDETLEMISMKWATAYLLAFDTSAQFLIWNRAGRHCKL